MVSQLANFGDKFANFGEPHTKKLDDGGKKPSKKGGDNGSSKQHYNILNLCKELTSDALRGDMQDGGLARY